MLRINQKSVAQYLLLLSMSCTFLTPLLAQTNLIKEQVLALISRQNSVIHPVPEALKNLDAMVVNLLIDHPNRVLTPYPTSQKLQYQQMFRLKFTSSRDADLSVFQITQAGKINPKPIATENIKYGQETVTQQFFISPATQTKALLIVLHPKNSSQENALAWAQEGFHASPQTVSETVKVFHTKVSSYLIATQAQSSGLFTTLFIQ